MQIIPVAVLSLLASSPSAQPVQEGAESVEVTTRLIDLSGLHAATGDFAIVEDRVPLVPFVMAMPPADSEMRTDGLGYRESGAAGAFTDLLLEWNDMGLESMEILHGQRLMVEGTAEQLDQIEALISKIESLTAAQPRLDVISFSGSKELAGGRMTRAALDAALATASDVRRHSVTMPPRGLRRVADLEGHTCLQSVYSEIAHAATATRLYATDVKTGFELKVSSQHFGEHLNLSYSLMRSVRFDRPVWNGVVLEQRVNSEGGLLHVDRSERWAERFRASGGVVVGAASLREGEAVLLSVGTDGGTHLYCALCLTSQGGDTEGIRMVKLDDDHHLVAVPLSRAQRGLHVLRPVNPSAVDSFERPSGNTDYGGAYLEAAFGGYEDTAFWAARNQVEPSGEADIGGYLLGVYSREDARILQRAIEAEERIQPSQFDVRVESVDQLGATARGGTFSVVGGQPGALSSGLEGLVAKSNNVEVAQLASVREPVIVSHFQGIGLRVVANTLRDGRLAYQIQGQLSADLEEFEGAASKVSDSGLTATRAGYLPIDESGIAPSSEDGSWTFVLGDQSKAGAHVVVTITRAK